MGYCVSLPVPSELQQKRKMNENRAAIAVLNSGYATWFTARGAILDDVITRKL